MLRTRKAIVVLCIAVIVFAAVVRPVAHDLAMIVAPWQLFAAAAVRVPRRCPVRCCEQPVSLRSLLPSRAPPFEPVAG